MKTKYYFQTLALAVLSALSFPSCFPVWDITEFDAPAQASAGNAIPVHVRVDNTWGDTLTPKHNLYLSYDRYHSNDDVLLQSFNAPYVVQSNGYVDLDKFVSIPSNTMKGKYYLILKAYDNTSYRNIEITSGQSNVGIDLTAINLFVPTNYVTGQSYKINYTASNRGTQTSINSNTFYYLSQDAFLDANDVIVGGEQVDPINGGDRSEKLGNIYMPGFQPPGNYYLLINVDNGKSNAELNENNNLFSYSITISSPKPNLTADNLTAPVMAKPGANISTGVYIINNGNVDAFQFTCSYYLSNDLNFNQAGDWHLFSTSYPGLIHNNQSQRTDNLPLPWGIPTGIYYLYIVVDSYQQINEGNESDNYKHIPIAIYQSLPNDGDDEIEAQYPALAERAALPQNELQAIHIDRNEDVEKVIAQIEESMTIYPNPVEKSATLNTSMDLAHYAGAKLSIRDVGGKEIQSITLPEYINPTWYMHSFNLNNIPAGTYVISAEIKGRSPITKKFVVQ